LKEDTTTVEVCPAIAIQPSESELSPDDKIQLVLQAVDALGNEVPWKLEGVTWDTTTPGIVSVDPSLVDRWRASVQGLSPGMGYVRAVYEGECGTQSVTAQVQVQADILEGDWNVAAIWGEQECYVNGSPDLETNFANDGSLTLSVEQSGPLVAAQYSAYPESEPYTGTVEATTDPLRPYDLELSVASNKTADCVELERSGKTIYGEEVCSNCTATDCFETEQVTGYVTPGGKGFFGTSTWGLTASSGSNSLSCEGEAALVGCREGNPWPLFVDTPCGSTEEAELLCTDFYSPDWLYADCIPSFRDGSPRLVCVYCQQ
jgi:hypothetical protein